MYNRKTIPDYINISYLIHLYAKEEFIMATEKQWSISDFINYGNSRLQDAAKADWERNFKKMNYPNKDEYKEILDSTEMDISATLEAMPETIGGFVSETGRPFNIPAPNDTTSSASIRIKDVEEKESEGTIQFGENKGQTWHAKTLAHSEFAVKNNSKKFKTE